MVERAHSDEAPDLVHARIREVFLEVFDLAAIERARRLDEVSRLEPRIRAEVEELLAADAAELPAQLSRIVDFSPHETMPNRIGGYRILERLGQGGMGVVWLAEQESPKRRVALKVIRDGFASALAQRRFEHEARVLARLQHAGICQVYEAGIDRSNGTERPFFVMELVRGEPITEYANRRRLGANDRVELLIRVCDAVFHAHTRGVVHRDLKPGNVLVSESGEVKVLDFGIARAIGSHADSASITRTSERRIVGTLPYMSPEQVRGDSDAVDERADVYALGALGYELLAGRLPLDLADRTLIASLRAIEDEEPPRLAVIDRAYSGDLDTIFSKALEKDRDRRYRTAADLGAELRRFLRHEPILAHPPSTLYQLRKFARRRPGIVASAILLLLGSIGTTWQAIRATAQRDRAVEAESLAAARLVLVEREADVARDAASFLADIFAAASPEDRGRDTRVVDVLADAGREIDARFSDRADVRGLLFHTIGSTWRVLGEYERADELLAHATALRRAELGDDDEETLRSKVEWVRALVEQDRFRDAIPLLDEADAGARRSLREDDPLRLSIGSQRAAIRWKAGEFAAGEADLHAVHEAQSRTLGDDHEDSIATLAEIARLQDFLGRADDAARTLDAVLDASRRRFGDDHLRTWSARYERATFLFRQTARIAEAKAAIAEVHAALERLLGADHPKTLQTLGELATIALENDEDATAVRLARDAAERSAKKLGEEHEATLQCRILLARLLGVTGEKVEAEHLGSETVARAKARYGDESPVVLSIECDYATTLFRIGKYGESATAYARILPLATAKLGATNPLTVRCENGLSVSIGLGGDPEEGITRLTKLVSDSIARFGVVHPTTILHLNNLGTMEVRAGRVDAGIENVERSLDARLALCGERDPAVLTIATEVAAHYPKAGRLDDTISALRRAIRFQIGLHGEQHVRTIQLLTALVRHLDRTANDEAIDVSQYVVDLARETLPANDPKLLLYRLNEAYVLYAFREYGAARALLSGMLEEFRAAFGESDPSTFKATWMYGMALYNVGERARAEPYLCESVALLRAHRFVEGVDALTLEGRWALALLATGREGEARPILDRVFVELERLGQSDHWVAKEIAEARVAYGSK